MNRIYLRLMLILAISVIAKTGYTQNGWSMMFHPVGPDTLFGQLQFVTVNEGWIKTGNGGLMHTTDGGTTWTRVYPFPNDSLYNGSDFAMGMSWGSQTHGYTLNSVGDIDNMFQSSGVVLLSTANAGATWTKKQLATAGWNALGIQFVDAANGWVNMFNPSVGIQFMRTTDGGANWVSYPYNSNYPYSIVTTFSFADPLNGWAVTTWKNDTAASVPTRWSVEKTSDGGQNWQRMYTDTAVNVMMLSSIKAIDANTCWVMGPSRTYLRTTDGGANFSKKALPTSFSYQSKHKNMYATDATHCWITEDAEDDMIECKIHHSSDGGQTWQMQSSGISGSLFYVWFLDSMHGWFVGETCYNCFDSTDHRDIALTGKTSNGGSTGVSDLSGFENAIGIYPNPSNGNFSITAEQVEINGVDILNSRGERVSHTVFPSHTHALDVDLSDCSKGLYFVRISSGNGIVIRPVLIR